MKTVVLSDISREAGGLFYSVRALSKGLRECGEEIEVISPLRRYTMEDLAEWAPLKVQLYKGYGPLLFSFHLRSLLREAAPEIIHLHGIWRDEQWASLQAQNKLGSKIIISPRGMLDPWAVQNSAWKKRLVSWLFAEASLRNATVLHALCESEYTSMRKYGLKNPIAVIPNGFDVPDNPGGHLEHAGLRQMLFVSRLHPKKGLPNLLEAWAELRRKSNREFGWQLVIAGWDQGGHLQELQKQCSELHLSWKEDLRENQYEFSPLDVIFVGSKYGKGKEMLMRSADGFILPSFSEGLPMAVLEAWAYAVPVVMTPQCNIPEGFDAAAALRVEPEVQSLSAGLTRFFALSDEERHTMGENGRQLLLEKFTWPVIAREMQKVYHWCVSGGELPSCVRLD